MYTINLYTSMHGIGIGACVIEVCDAEVAYVSKLLQKFFQKPLKRPSVVEMGNYEYKLL